METTKYLYNLAYRIARLIAERGDATGRGMTEDERYIQVPMVIMKAAVYSRIAYRVPYDKKGNALMKQSSWKDIKDKYK